jgi:hypothetical protein
VHVTLIGVGVGVGVGLGDVRVVGRRVANELVDEELLVGSVLSKVVYLLFEVFVNCWCKTRRR